MGFAEWLQKIEEAGTDTGSIASFKMPLFAAPVRRKKIKGIVFGDDPFFHKKTKLAEEAPIQAVNSLAQTLPQGTQPSLRTPLNADAVVSDVNPVNYKGAQKSLYQNIYQKYLKSRDSRLASALSAAINGDETRMASVNSSYQY